MVANAIQGSILSHSIDLQQYDTDTLKNVVAVLQNVASDLEQTVLEGASYPDDPPLRYARAEHLRQQAIHTIDAAYQQIEGTHTAALVGLGKVEADFAMNVVNHTVGVNLAKNMLTNAELDAVISGVMIEGAPSKQWWSRQSESLKNQFGDTMTKGILEGETIPQMVRRVRGTKAMNYSDGIMDASYSRAEALVRTSGMAVANKVRESTFEKNSDIIKVVKWVATLDHKVCLKCAPRDGLTWSYPDYKPIGHDKKYISPPAHFSCRCTTVPVLKSYRELAGLPDAGKIDEGTRASMDGQVPADVTYEQWLKGQPEEAQKSVLGNARFELWKSGKLSMAEMTKPSNQVLTLEQLVAKPAVRLYSDKAVSSHGIDLQLKHSGNKSVTLTPNAYLFAQKVPFTVGAASPAPDDIGQNRIALALNYSVSQVKDIQGFANHVKGIKIEWIKGGAAGTYNPISRTIKIDFVTPEGSPSNVLIHETAHALDDFHRVKAGYDSLHDWLGYDYSKTGSARSKLATSLDEEIHKARRAIEKDMPSAMTIPSSYALHKNQAEWVAEWYTQRMLHPEIASLARKDWPVVNEWIDTWLKGK